MLTETPIGDVHRYRCHVGHAYSLSAIVGAQAESVERALWSAVRALEESAALTQRLATASSGSLRVRFEEKEQEQRGQAEAIKLLLHAQGRLSTADAAAVLAPQGPAPDPYGED